MSNHSPDEVPVITINSIDGERVKLYRNGDVWVNDPENLDELTESFWQTMVDYVGTLDEGGGLTLYGPLTLEESGGGDEEP